MWEYKRVWLKKGGILATVEDLGVCGSKQQLFISVWIFLTLNPEGLGKRPKDSFWEKLSFQGSSKSEWHFQFTPLHHMASLTHPPLSAPHIPISHVSASWKGHTFCTSHATALITPFWNSRCLSKRGFLLQRQQYRAGTWAKGCGRAVAVEGTRPQPHPKQGQSLNPVWHSSSLGKLKSRRTLQPDASWRSPVALILSKWRVGYADFS